MNERKKQLIAITLLLVFATIAILGTYYYVTSTGLTDPIVGWIFFYHFEFMLLISLGGVAMGALSFYLFDSKIDRKTLQQREIVKKNTRVLLDFLDFDEKRIVEKLLEEKGKARQYELAYAASLGKVRAHRAVKKLSSKGVVEVQRLGKVNTIKLKPEILQGLSD